MHDDNRWHDAGPGWYQSNPGRVPTVHELNRIYRKPFRERINTMINIAWAGMIVGGCILVWFLIALCIGACIAVVEGKVW
jgi:hypothetical protein